MARFKHKAKKQRLAKAGRQTRWAPFWTSVRIFGKSRRVHPGRQTAIKRNWRRSRTKI